MWVRLTFKCSFRPSTHDLFLMMMPLLIFAAYTAALTPNAFKWAEWPPQLPLPVKGFYPRPIHSCLGATNSAPNGISIDFFRPTDRQTDTDNATPSLTIGRIWLLLRRNTNGLLAPNNKLSSRTAPDKRPQRTRCRYLTKSSGSTKRRAVPLRVVTLHTAHCRTVNNKVYL